MTTKKSNFNYMGMNCSKNMKKLYEDKRKIYISKRKSLVVKLWIYYSKIKNKNNEENEFVRYLEDLTIELK
ncbi:hypothetical protein Catovirus_1_846 [Catovirus CTV1]|uniref:Uncharacterized protein n=1 Tax=Catovirus CTV1 TaxID=1977631 RepID=A0A1V0SAR9_9VIRU|nr:hypothetical protein Catovirus_1_846 [Catovirus CTV1]